MGVTVCQLVPGSRCCLCLGVFCHDGSPGVPSPAAVFLGAYCPGWRWPSSGFAPTPHLALALASPTWYLDLPGLVPALSSALCEGHFQRPPSTPTPTSGSYLSVCGQSSPFGRWPEWELQPPLAS